MTDEFDGPVDADDATEAAAAIPQPRANPDLVGQQRAERALIEAWRSGRLPHAWLLTGPRGIGKATLAFRFARFLFAEAGTEGDPVAAPPTSLQLNPATPAFRRVASGGHADLLVIEKGYDPKRKRRRSEIVIDDVRQIGDFLHLTPAEGGWRIVIIDGADEMNRNAANALLKVLEEPSRRALLLITSASAGRLLPTIRSRCRHLALDLLSESQLIGLLGKYLPSEAPEKTAEVAALAGGSIGRALDLTAGGGLGLYREINDLLMPLPTLDGIAIERFADRLGRSGAEDAFRLATELISGRVARLIKAAATGGQGDGADDPLIHLVPRPSLDRWVEVWENLNRTFTLVDVVNLDRKEAVLNAFFALEDASR
ncbi:MAG: DNA polymerase III subunit delta' [Stellaceae bacterium]